MDDFELYDHYEVLGVPRDASPEEIDEAYRAAMLREHPDRSAHPQANERAIRVNEAGRVLLDPDRRRQYDPDADIRQRRDRVGLQHLPPLGEEEEGSSASGSDPQSRGGAQEDADRYARVAQTASRSQVASDASGSNARPRRLALVGVAAVVTAIAAALVYLLVLRTDADLDAPLIRSSGETTRSEPAEAQTTQTLADQQVQAANTDEGRLDSRALQLADESASVSDRDWELTFVRSDGYQVLYGLELSSISAGWAHSCALAGDAGVTCWGDNWSGRTEAPTGRYRQVSAGVDHNCALGTDGGVVCWGANEFRQTDAPAGRFSQVSAGAQHSCALETDGGVVCWGDNGYGQSDAPAGRFSQVSAGYEHSCALRTDDGVLCWGGNRYGQTDAPAGRFSQVSAGGNHNCALETNGGVVCWGYNPEGRTTAPAGRYSQVTVGYEHSCALETEGGVVCWGANWDGQAAAPTGRFIQVSAGYEHSCALGPDGVVVCWGKSQFANLHVTGERVTVEEAASEIVVRQRDQSDTNAEDQSTHSLAEQTQESDAEGEREATEPNTEPDIDQRVPARESNGNDEQATVANKTAELEPDSQEDRSSGGLEEDDGDLMEDASDGLEEDDGDSMEDASDGLEEDDGDLMEDDSDVMEADDGDWMEDDGPVLFDLTSLSGFATYTGPDTIASELMLLLGGRATSIGLWNGSRWVLFGVVGGMIVPGSQDFSVIEGDVLYIEN